MQPIYRDDRYDGVLLNVIDVTEFVEARRQAERTRNELAVLNRELEATIDRANRMTVAAKRASATKSEFLPNMSHEIHTPMNAILGMTELARDLAQHNDQREHLRMAGTSAEALLRVIDDILGLSRIEAGRMELRAEMFRLTECVEGALGPLAVRAAGKGLELVWWPARDVPEVLVGDPGRLRQVVVNLVGNAIKFTETGEIVLRAEGRESSAQNVRLHFSVADTGIGMAPEKQEEIFESFTQVDGSATRKHGGTGLGLAICIRLIGMMDGQLSVESPVSETGAGSCFHFVVGFRRPGSSRRDDEAAETAELPPARVLVVEDSTTLRQALSERLRAWGSPPVAVAPADMPDPLRRTGNHAAPYAVMLLDADLPDRGTVALLGQVRKDRRLVEMPVLLLQKPTPRTKRCSEGDLGALGRLAKPVRQADLLSMLRAALACGPSPEPPRLRSPGPSHLTPRRPLHILLAEDNRLNQKLAVSLLGKWGHEVVVAGNGREALRAALGGSFDLVLMDIQMPELGGLDAAAAIRRAEGPGRPRVPIIALTARAAWEDEQQCLRAGMDGYVTKPFRPREFFEGLACQAEAAATRAKTYVEEIAHARVGSG